MNFFVFVEQEQVCTPSDRGRKEGNIGSSLGESTMCGMESFGKPLSTKNVDRSTLDVPSIAGTNGTERVRRKDTNYLNEPISEAVTSAILNRRRTDAVVITYSPRTKRGKPTWNSTSPCRILSPSL